MPTQMRVLGLIWCLVPTFGRDWEGPPTPGVALGEKQRLCIDAVSAHKSFNVTVKLHVSQLEACLDQNGWKKGLCLAEEIALNNMIQLFVDADVGIAIDATPADDQVMVWIHNIKSLVNRILNDEPFRPCIKASSVITELFNTMTQTCLSWPPFCNTFLSNAIQHIELTFNIFDCILHDLGDSFLEMGAQWVQSIFDGTFESNDIVDDLQASLQNVGEVIDECASERSTSMPTTPISTPMPTTPMPTRMPTTASPSSDCQPDARDYIRSLRDFIHWPSHENLGRVVAERESVCNAACVANHQRLVTSHADEATLRAVEMLRCLQPTPYSRGLGVDAGDASVVYRVYIGAAMLFSVCVGILVARLMGVSGASKVA